MPATNLGTSGWNTQGSVDIAPSTGSGQAGTATLNEVSTSQTRLNQIFMLGANDHYLTFTLSSAALSGNNPLPNPLPQAGEGARGRGGEGANGARGAAQPLDAFQIALLDANTGASLLGGDGQTRSDAFLSTRKGYAGGCPAASQRPFRSLQADGSQHMADCVTCINNADGSRTYRVDLSNVPRSIAVNLSFDLLGFGANDSHITLRDVRTSDTPQLQLRDAAVSMAEDKLLTFNPLAQADSTITANLPASIVDAPAHGSITVNADGTFSYTPALNYFGTDSFSYRLSDGTVDSNLATVSLTIAAVNDAPVAADAQATTAEDTPLVIALGAYASDGVVKGIRP